MNNDSPMVIDGNGTPTPCGDFGTVQRSGGIQLNKQREIMSRIAVISIIIAVFAPLLPGDDSVDLTEKMKDSLVFLEVSRTSWEQLQPWRQTAVSTAGVYGTAVGSNEVLTIAGPLANATSIRARRYDQNEYISARIKAIDYEYNLCLLELDEAAIRTPLEPLQFLINTAEVKTYILIVWTRAGALPKAEPGWIGPRCSFRPSRLYEPCTIY